MLKNCAECNRVFSHPTRELCQECHDETLKSYDAVRNYLKENPGATVAQVAQDTEVAVELIYDYIRQGRLDIVPKDASLYCAICGAAISVGRVCARCRSDLRSTMTKESVKPQVKPTGTGRLHIADHIKDR